MIDKKLTTNSEKALLFQEEPLIIQENNNPGQAASGGVGARNFTEGSVPAAQGKRL